MLMNDTGKIWRAAAILFLSLTLLFAEKPDLNTLDANALCELGLSNEAVEAILNYRLYHGGFESIYELSTLEGVSHKEFVLLKEHVAVFPILLTAEEQRIEDNYYQLERMTFSEGSSEGLVEEWIRLLSSPENINRMDYFDFMNLPGVSPVDAVAVERFIASDQTITSARDLRSIESLSYYGYRNIGDYVRFTDDEDKGWHGYYNTTVKNSQQNIVPDEDAESLQIFQSKTTPLDIYHKLLVNKGNTWSGGVSYNRPLGQNDEYYQLGSLGRIPRVKAFLSYEPVRSGDFRLNKLIAGNYVAAFGQGVIMESVDYFTPRKSGYGWRKRLYGISGDVSKNTYVPLRGLTGEIQWKSLYFTPFVSFESRDAVLNSDESFSMLIRMEPRYEYGLNGQLTEPLTRTVDELLYGSNFRWRINTSTHIGITAYESLYDREKEFQIQSVVSPENLRYYLNHIGNSADTEIASIYENSGESALWSKAKSYRRVLGGDFSTVYKNLVLQGEIGILDLDGAVFDLKKDPMAWLVNMYWQFDNFNILLLYRDYDLAYDNPYQRSFSNYQRYKSTIFEDVFYLKDPSLGFLYTGAPQPQAERGFYFNLRYQFHRQFVTTVEHDIWTRVADQSKYNRLVFNLEYRPVFNYRFRLRQKWQSRGGQNIFSPTGYESTETRLEGIMRMSRHNELRLLLATGYTAFNPRPRLTANTAGGTSMVGNAGSPSKAIAAQVRHNFNDRFKVMGQMMIYEGFIWNFEDTDFRVFNTDSEAFHGWIAFFSRLSPNLSARFKYSFDRHGMMDSYVGGTVTTVSGDYEITDITARNTYNDFRIQLDYRF